jgi:membrane-bound ClpP family serine protease
MVGRRCATAYDFPMAALGVSLLVLGAIVIVVEAHVPTLGLLGGPGVVALAAGAVLTVGALGGGLALELLTALLLTCFGVAVLGVSLRKAASVRRRRVRSGPEGLMGHLGTVRSWTEPTGQVLIDGALWRARRSWSEEGLEELRAGDRVVVERLDGLTLVVRRAEEWELVR